jgi:hypothetical protein
MALGRPAYKVPDRQASRTSQAGLADLLGVARCPTKAPPQLLGHDLDHRAGAAVFSGPDPSLVGA